MKQQYLVVHLDQIARLVDLMLRIRQQYPAHSLRGHVSPNGTWVIDAATWHIPAADSITTELILWHNLELERLEY